MCFRGFFFWVSRSLKIFFLSRKGKGVFWGWEKGWRARPLSKLMKDSFMKKSVSRLHCCFQIEGEEFREGIGLKEVKKSRSAQRAWDREVFLRNLACSHRELSVCPRRKIRHLSPKSFQEGGLVHVGQRPSRKRGAASLAPFDGRAVRLSLLEDYYAYGLPRNRFANGDRPSALHTFGPPTKGRRLSPEVRYEGVPRLAPRGL